MPFIVPLPLHYKVNQLKKKRKKKKRKKRSLLACIEKYTDLRIALTLLITLFVIACNIVTLPDELIETGHPDRGLQLVALRVRSHYELPANTRCIASVILPTSPTGVPHCGRSPYTKGEVGLPNKA